MPDTTIIIDRAQRDGLYELVRNHLGAVGDLWDALERDKDFATAARLGLEFGEDFELLEDIGWGEDEGRESFNLTMPPHDLMELFKRLHGEAEQVLLALPARPRRVRGAAGQARRGRGRLGMIATLTIGPEGARHAPLAHVPAAVRLGAGPA